MAKITVGDSTLVHILGQAREGESTDQTIRRLLGLSPTRRGRPMVHPIYNLEIGQRVILGRVADPTQRTLINSVKRAVVRTGHSFETRWQAGGLAVTRVK